MNDIDQFITPELRAAVDRFGFDKVAAKMYGVEEINEKTASEIVGVKLMTRLAEWRQVATGLEALQELQKTSEMSPVVPALLGVGIPLAMAAVNLLGKPLGHAMGRAQAERGEPHTYGASQTVGSLLPGGAGYQEGRFMAHATADKSKDKKKDKKDEE
jgi:hypothetical protein